MHAASVTDGHVVDPPSENTEDEEEDLVITDTTTSDESEDDFPPAVSYVVNACPESSNSGARGLGGP